jgi:CubicO group peptidase (beta-lactamase class C family)
MKNKKRIIQLIIIIPSIISLFFVPWNLLFYWMSPGQDSVQEEMDNALDRGFDGIVVYIDQAGQIETYEAGTDNRLNDTPTDQESLFKIASISKLYVAVAAVKVIDQGLLSTDDTLSDLLPEFADRIENSEEITLRMLIQHRSGIPNYMDDPDYPWANLPTSNIQTLELVLDDPADFEPDKKYKYSNTNFLLIGEILDKTLGYSHHDYIYETILQPLHLTNTFNLLKDVDIDLVMSGYHVGYEEDQKYDDYISPSGSMVATIEDVGVFIRALNTGSLLTPSEQKLYGALYTYGHTGLLPGFQSFAYYHENIDTVVIQFNNTSGGAMWTKGEILYNNILKLLK